MQRRVGLHHLCFRARTREDIDAAYHSLREFGAKIVHPPEEGSWAPGYYSVLFEDPDGIRLEMNFVPVKVCSRKSRAILQGHGRVTDFGVAGLAIDHQHLNLLIVALGKKDVAAHGEVVRDILLRQRQRTELRGGLLISAILSTLSTAEHPRAGADRSADDRAWTRCLR